MFWEEICQKKLQPFFLEDDASLRKGVRKVVKRRLEKKAVEKCGNSRHFKPTALTQNMVALFRFHSKINKIHCEI